MVDYRDHSSIVCVGLNREVAGSWAVLLRVKSDRGGKDHDVSELPSQSEVTSVTGNGDFVSNAFVLQLGTAAPFLWRRPIAVALLRERLGMARVGATAKSELYAR